MPRITVRKRDGDAVSIDASTGGSLMQTLRDGGVAELLAICGGGLSCATCHVHVDPDWIARLPPMSEDEDALLDAPGRQPGSRLSCQVQVTDALDGLKLAVAPQD